MHISPINNAQSFKSLDTKFVEHPISKELVKKEYKELLELGKKYDIQLKSFYYMTTNIEVIQATVFPLNSWSPMRSCVANFLNDAYKYRKTIDADRCSSVVNLVNRVIKMYEEDEKK